MTTLRQAAQQALEALGKINKLSVGENAICLPAEIDGAMDALRAALAESEPRNQCGETCERAKLCAVCARGLAEPAQEPVAWRTFDGEGGYDYRSYEMNEDYGEWWEHRHPNHKGWVEPLYTAPPQRKPLTEEEIKVKAMEAFNSYWDGDDETLVNKYGHGVYLSRFIEFARAIEAAHGIKEKK